LSALAGASVDWGDPGWFLDWLDASSGCASFVRTSREALSAQPFLDDRWRRPAAPLITAPLAQLPQPLRPPRLGFIWHTSLCASTLLASRLDAPGQRLALKEPRALMDLAELKRRGGGRLADPGLARAVFGLYARRFEPHESVLVKPSNGANALIPEAAALTEGPMLLLHGDCESFLISAARDGQGGFGYVRELFMTLAADGHPAGRWPPNRLFKLTDLQLAALVWRMQMDVLEAASHLLGPRARSLDFRRFLQTPGPVLEAVDELFGLDVGRARIAEVLAGPAFARNAKAPGQPFDPETRAAEGRRVREQLGEDLPAVLHWIARLYPAPPKLAPPLETASPSPADAQAERSPALPSRL
jgi:hypothetical protein